MAVVEFGTFPQIIFPDLKTSTEIQNCVWVKDNH
jgi:hypothetical protein